MFGVIYAAAGSSTETLAIVARAFSPRIELCGAREVLLDLSGLERLFGDTRAMGEALRRDAADRGLRVRVAIAGTQTAARLMAHHRPGLMIVEPGTEAETLAPLPLALLTALAQPDSSASTVTARNAPNSPNDMLSTFRRWGLRTLGELAGLPPGEVAARLGQPGVAWQRWARGEDVRPLQPAVPEEHFEQALDLEWPIEGLEPLSFVLGRLLEPLSAHLERRDRGAAVLRVRLHLVRSHDGTRDIHECALELPTPMRDARTLRTLALLELESRPPAAAIDRVVVSVDSTPGRVLQCSLLTRPLPSPGQISTLLARLNALMGQGRCGAPAEADSWQPGAFAMTPFIPAEGNRIPSGKTPRHRGAETPTSVPESLGVSVPRCPVGVSEPPLAVALRRFRLPVAVRVRVESGAPVRVDADRQGLSGNVTTCAGPWRTSGGWWEPPMSSWDRDEWDVTLSDGATYRLFRARDVGTWFIEGIVD